VTSLCGQIFFLQFSVDIRVGEMVVFFRVQNEVEIKKCGDPRLYIAVVDPPTYSTI
jgi:hypothetical protein